VLILEEQVVVAKMTLKTWAQSITVPRWHLASHNLDLVPSLDYSSELAHLESVQEKIEWLANVEAKLTEGENALVLSAMQVSLWGCVGVAHHNQLLTQHAVLIFAVHGQRVAHQLNFSHRHPHSLEPGWAANQIWLWTTGCHQLVDHKGCHLALVQALM
jgi:hypothetical protein